MYIPHLKNTFSHHKSHHFFRLTNRLNRFKQQVRTGFNPSNRA